jgi:hypothetical protein
MNEKLIKSINDFIMELLILFEDRNSSIYSRLLFYRHYVRNVADHDDLKTKIEHFLKQPHILSMIQTKNPKLQEFILQNSSVSDQLKITINILWESCTSENKATIWNWVQAITNSILCFDLV